MQDIIEEGMDNGEIDEDTYAYREDEDEEDK